MDHTLDIGRIVHYVLEDGDNAGEERPAIVVRVWNDDCVQLQVFTDGSNDYQESPNMSGRVRAALAIDATAPADKEHVHRTVAYMVWKTSRVHNANKLPGTWHWPDE